MNFLKKKRKKNKKKEQNKYNKKPTKETKKTGVDGYAQYNYHIQYDVIYNLCVCYVLKYQRMLGVEST